MTLTFRQKTIYFLSALVMYQVFRHGLGPHLGLDGLWLIVGAYVFAVVLPSFYLYRLWAAKRGISSTKDAS
jgi:hypothetical protein